MNEKQEANVPRALLYPVALATMCFAIVSILLVYVVPKVTDVFTSYKAQLPLATRILIGVSNFARHYGIYTAIGAALLMYFGLWQPKKHLSRFDGLRLSAMVGLLGPLLILTMGVVIIGIVFAMLLPIFQMNSPIH